MKNNSSMPTSETDGIGYITVDGNVGDADESLLRCDLLTDRCLEMARSDSIRVVVFDCSIAGCFTTLEAYGRALLSYSVFSSPERPSLIDALAAMPQPVIAEIDGDAVGIGLEAVLACDIRVASGSSCFGLPQIRQGSIPCFGGTQRLLRTVSKGSAFEMLLTGETIDADTAHRIGLINRVVSRVDLQASVLNMAVKMAGKGPISLQYVKEAVYSGMELTLEQGLGLEADLYFLLHTTEDRTEGVRAFRGKRPANFRGK